MGKTCSFLVSAQETNQRKRLGEALTAKSFVSADINRQSYPNFEPPVLLRCPSILWYKSFFRHPLRVDETAVVGLRLFRLQQVCRLAPEGVHRGGRLEAGVGDWVYSGCPDRLRGQRLPYAGFFSSFSCRTKKRTDTQINDYFFSVFSLIIKI